MGSNNAGWQIVQSTVGSSRHWWHELVLMYLMYS